VDQAERGQRLQLRLRGAGHGARRIDVFDAQPPQAAVMAGEQPAAEGGEQGSGVEQAGRRGREAAAGNGEVMLAESSVRLALEFKLTTPQIDRYRPLPSRIFPCLPALPCSWRPTSRS
jgi:hypothetical protein